MLRLIGLLMQGFNATTQGISLDNWLAGLAPEDRALLTSWSKHVAGVMPWRGHCEILPAEQIEQVEPREREQS